MSITTEAKRGGAWLIETTAPGEVFTPEKLSDEHRLIGQTAAEFVTNEVLPTLVAGDLVGAYALSESGSGSDALGAKAHAVRDADGNFVLSGEKMWITNGGFADLFIVFAKVDGEQFTAFIVERAFPGVSNGK